MIIEYPSGCDKGVGGLITWGSVDIASGLKLDGDAEFIVSDSVIMLEGSQSDVEVASGALVREYVGADVKDGFWVMGTVDCGFVSDPLCSVSGELERRVLPVL